MINRVVLVGRLTKDPELRYTPSGVAMARFTLAVNRTFSNQSGEREADFINCVVWRKQAENTANFLKKGSLAGVEGRIQTGSYEGQDGKRVYTTDVVADSVQFLEPRNSSGERNQGGQSPGGNGQQQFSTPSYQQNQPMNQQNYTRVDEDPFSNSSGPIEVSDDDLPF
ncbi:single-stranded DNA-binding protein [Psychrobacillus psychrodurans]|jgi:single-strand DNA-binding protein|uniref:single-stranded DNA-binding protein n=1 Tax=Psychrobacillus TaxID=1221880 RepID=UPI0008E98C67|nr:single-stranded DNA-binding protein [Psychrobacillus psychrodurans]MCK1997903.1 single-stranded DNA-binding protein [Psychrobacillus psychrodurans]MCZ8541085.1 single-stranded DNA-binding protein [Psychrobacillus psychrodurans]SFM84132.1 single-strand DNA-binding protein [Psychrobacillus psychrodurans]